MSLWVWMPREGYTVILKTSGDEVSIDKHVPPQIQGNHEKDPPPEKKGEKN